MKRMTRLLVCAALAAGFATQETSAGVLLTNVVENIQGMGVRARAFNTTNEVYDQRYDKAYTRSYGDPDPANSTGHDVGKAYIQFNLSSVLAFYGKSNLVSANLWLWGENGTSRDFDMYSLKDSAGLESWDMNTLLWTNAPANITNSGYKFDTNLCYGNGPIWVFRETAIDVSRPDLGGNYDQDALYISPADNTNFLGVLEADTDGLVTFMWGGFNNQNWWVGTNGTYMTPPTYPIYSTDGQYLSASSPTLTLVFDVRVALTGGGSACPGGSGPEIYLGGTDVGFDYLLYTNGVYAGQTVSGTGSSVSFGQQNVEATYTAVESNITTTATRLIPGAPVVNFYADANITTQPAPYTAATNSVAIYEITATGDALSYQWYRNGSPLSDDGHYSGTTTSQLMIDPVLASDAATAANGYYCVVTNPCGSMGISTTNALTIQAARNLVWIGTPSNTWDIATSVNWSNTASSTMTAFEQGDNVTLDDNALDTTLDVASSYLAPGVITFNASGTMTMGGNGDIFGPNSSLVVNGPTGSSTLEIQNANSFTGGTTINDGWLILDQNESAGTGIITMAGTGLSVLEVKPKGGANVGIPGLDVIADSVVQFDQGGGGGYAGAILGPLSGTAGKTLRIYMPGGTPGDNIRLWNTNFTCDANLNLDIVSATLAPYNYGGLQTYNGVISGSGTLFTRVFGGGRIILNGANTYTGGTRFSAGTTGIGIDSVGVDYSVTSGALGTGPVTMESNVGIFASGGPHTLGNPFVYTAGGGELRFTDTNVLTIAGTFDLGSGGISSAVDRTISADSGTTGIISGAIGDTSGYGCGLIKDGNGTLLLNGVNTYTGTTTVTDGTLGGTGTIAGPVVVDAGQSLAPGASVGTLTINSDLTVNGDLDIEVDKSLAPGQTNDIVLVSGGLTNAGTGTVTVANLGPALNAGDRFVLFAGKAMTGGSALTVTGAGMIWTNKLAVDGSIEVVVPIATTPTNITYSVSGGTNLTLSWPPNYQGWSLQVQSNPLNVGLSTNWTTLGYENTTSAVINIDPGSPAVFYRLFYEAP